MNNRSLNEVDTIILGAGISGLTLGYYLNKREKDFLIFESSKCIGGNISTKNKKNSPDRLELKKFNPILKKYTIQTEIK